MVNWCWLICHGVGEIEDNQGKSDNRAPDDADFLLPGGDAATSHFGADDVDDPLRQDKKGEAPEYDRPQVAGLQPGRGSW